MRIPDYPSADSQKWSQVDSYFSGLLAPEDDVLKVCLAENAKAGMPAHDVSASQGKMLALFIAMTGASRVLEIGTLGGYSTIWMARALPGGGRVVTIEANELHAAVAISNIERAGMGDRVDVHVGPALDVLPNIARDSDKPFDLIFIDADKPNNPNYLQWSLKLSRPGTVIIADNVVRGGAVADPYSEDANVIGVREFLAMVAETPDLDATAIQTVGEKGWDGFSLIRVK